MPRAALDLVALHDALSCCATAADQAWRGDWDSASLSLLEAHAAAEEAFGRGSPEVDALNIVFSAIKQAAGRDVRAPRPALDQSRLGQERTMTHPTTTSALRTLTETLEGLAADVAEIKRGLRYELSLAYAAGREAGWASRPARPRRQPAERPAHLQLVEGRRSS